MQPFFFCIFSHSLHIPLTSVVIGFPTALSSSVCRRIIVSSPSYLLQSCRLTNHLRLLFSDPAYKGKDTVPSTIIKNLTAVSVCAVPLPLSPLCSSAAV